MFGVTTLCVDEIHSYLTTHYPHTELYIFHATGHGGKAMERMISEGNLDAILDVTTTEIGDELFGGNMSAGPRRLEAALEKGIPYIISLGATDMVNFGAKGTIPERYRNRKILEHNPTVTLMRTTKEECALVGKFIVDKIKRFAKDPKKVQVWLPLGGVSVVDTPGAVFHDKEADEVLFGTVRKGLLGTEVKVVEDERDINDAGFAKAMSESLISLL